MNYSNFSPNYLVPETQIKTEKKKKKNRKNKKVIFSEENDIIQQPISSSIEDDYKSLKLQNNSFNNVENNVILESKFSLRNMIIKLLLFLLFICIIYLTYLFIFNKNKFLEVIHLNNPFKSNNTSKPPVTKTFISSEAGNSSLPVTNNNELSDNYQISNAIDSLSNKPIKETKVFNSELKGGLEYIDNDQLVKDIMSILKQAN